MALKAAHAPPFLLLEGFFYAFCTCFLKLLVCLSLVESERSFDELEPDEGEQEQAANPPPGQRGEWADFEEAQGRRLKRVDP